MMRLPNVLFLACVGVLAASSSGLANIVSVVEVGLAGDPAAIAVNGGFGEDVPAFADRIHQHNGARFSDAYTVLFGAGTMLPTRDGWPAQGVPETVVTNVPLPSYLVGGDYVRFANAVRDNPGYSATITASSRAAWYLLVDNRIDGPNAAMKAFPEEISDPILGGTLQWVIDGGWQRVNTGINPPLFPSSPPLLSGHGGDYTGVDESPADGSGLGVGPGISVNNFYAVYTLPNRPTTITVGNIGVGANMIQVVAVVPEPATLSLLALGGLGLAGFRHRRHV